MVAKKTVVVIKPFKDRDGRDHRIGDRMEVDPDYGVEIIRDGNGREEVDNTLPTPPNKPDNTLPTGGAKPDQSLPTPPKAEPK